MEGSLPPIADISAPQAVPDAVRRRANGTFLGIDDLYERTVPLPGAYIEDAERLVAAKTAELVAWLERAP
jgi:glutamyl-tRNA reductase